MAYVVVTVVAVVPAVVVIAVEFRNLFPSLLFFHFSRFVFFFRPVHSHVFDKYVSILKITDMVYKNIKPQW